jgi:hypothetical protein
MEEVLQETRAASLEGTHAVALQETHALQAPLPGSSVSSSASTAPDVAPSAASFAFAETAAEQQQQQQMEAIVLPAVLQPVQPAPKEEEKAVNLEPEPVVEQATGDDLSDERAAREAPPLPSAQPGSPEMPGERTICDKPAVGEDAAGAFAIAGGWQAICCLLFDVVPSLT